MAKDITISPRVTESAKKAIAKLADKPSTAAGLVLESFPYFYNYTLRELKGYFSESELNGLVSSYNGTMLTEQFYSNTAAFIIHMEDSEEFESVSAMYSFDFKPFLDKCKKLTAGQVFILLLEINRFWNVPAAYGSPSPSLEKFHETFKK